MSANGGEPGYRYPVKSPFVTAPLGVAVSCGAGAMI